MKRLILIQEFCTPHDFANIRALVCITGIKFTQAKKIVEDSYKNIFEPYELESDLSSDEVLAQLSKEEIKAKIINN